jgi:hypothetical protein
VLLVYNRLETILHPKMQKDEKPSCNYGVDALEAIISVIITIALFLFINLLVML